MDLTTQYLGLTLRNPVVASAGPLSQTVDGIRQLADGGVSAVVMYSLFEEQLRRSLAREAAWVEAHEESFGEALSYFPSVPADDDVEKPTKYLSLLERAASSVDVPVIASLNGSTMGGWTDFARQLQDAGAAAIELNVYLVPGDLHMSGHAVEQRHLDILRAVKDAVDVPVAMKLSPYFSSPGAMCATLDEAGADGLVLFNRFLQPDIDTETLEVKPGVALSSPAEGRLPRTWIAALRGKVGCSLAATSGVETAEDVIKYLLAGADVVMTTSSLLRHGPLHASELVGGVADWLERKQLTLDQARGRLAVPADADASGYNRAGYVAALEGAKSVYGSLLDA